MYDFCFFYSLTLYPSHPLFFEMTIVMLKINTVVKTD